MVVILDLSVPFNTVNHDTLLSILNKQFGICGKALERFNSYLQPRFFKVKIEKDYSRPQQLHFSVATGVMQWCQCIYMLLLINRPNCTKRYNTQWICRCPFTQEKLSSQQQDRGTTSKAQNGTHFQQHQRVDGQYAPQIELRKKQSIS